MVSNVFRKGPVGMADAEHRAVSAIYLIHAGRSRLILKIAICDFWMIVVPVPTIRLVLMVKCDGGNTENYLKSG